MPQRLTYFKESPSQTAGPYVHIGLIPHQAGFDIFKTNFSNILIGEKTAGEPIRIEGRVYDGAGTPVRDALLEIWQANAAGRYNHPMDRQDSTRASGAGAAPVPISERASTRSKRSSPAPSPAAPAEAQWHRTSIFGSPGVSISDCTQDVFRRRDRGQQQ